MRFAPHVVVDTSDTPPSQKNLSRANSYASGSQPRGRVEKHWGRGDIVSPKSKLTRKQEIPANFDIFLCIRSHWTLGQREIAVEDLTSDVISYHRAQSCSRCRAHLMSHGS